MLKRNNLRIRDPFILTDKENNCYYMYGTTALRQDTFYTGNSFSVYKTYDLENFYEPKIIFDGTKHNFWADRDFWAAEVHKYNEKYYLFGSCKSETRHRGTHIFVCDTPDGEFVPLSELPVTPSDWECLDGTLYVEDGTPYIVFCHEWTQVKDGEMCAMPLTNDLSHSAGSPFLLFHASDNPSTGGKSGNFITDGPFLYKENGMLKLLWSNSCQGKYQVLEAESTSIHGVWTHRSGKFDFDGGHAMLFTRLDGKRMISLHKPNTINSERAFFYEY